MCLGDTNAHLAAAARAQQGYVVSRDTDFCIFDTPGFLVLDDLEIAADGSVAYRLLPRFELARVLRVPSPLLPLLAVVLGTDHVPRETFALFRRGALPARAPGQPPSTLPPVVAVARRLAEIKASSAIEVLLPTSHAPLFSVGV